MDLSEWSVVRSEGFPLGRPQPELLTSLYSLLTITPHYAPLTPHWCRAVAERVLYVRGAFGLTPATDRLRRVRVKIVDSRRVKGSGFRIQVLHDKMLATHRRGRGNH